MRTQKTFFDIEKAEEQLTGEDIVEKVNSREKRVFCPVCERNVPLSFTVGGMCKDCFNND